MSIRKRGVRRCVSTGSGWLIALPKSGRSSPTIKVGILLTLPWWRGRILRPSLSIVWR